MPTGPIEMAEEAIKKLEDLKIVDKEIKDQADDSARPPRVRLSDEERRRIWEEKQATKKVLETGVTGKVKWYSVRGKYGFISRDDEKKDVFVHQTAIIKSAIIRFFLRTLADGEEVVFDVVEGDKGPEAANVTGPQGAEVKGSKYYHVLIHRRPPAKKDDDKKRSDKDETGEKKTKKKAKRRVRVRKPRKERESKGDREASETEEDESPEKPGRRRSSPEREKHSKQTHIASPKGSGDASLGAQPTAPAAVH